MNILGKSNLLLCILIVIQSTVVKATDNLTVPKWGIQVTQETSNVKRKFKTLVKLFDSSYGKLPETFLNINPGDARVGILKDANSFGVSFSQNGILETIPVPHMTAHDLETAGPLFGSLKILKKVTDAYFEQYPKLCETFKDYNRCELTPHSSGLVQIPSDVTYVEYRQLNKNIVLGATYCGFKIGPDMKICKVAYFWSKE